LDGDFSRNSFPTPVCVQTPFGYLNESVRFRRYCRDGEWYNFDSNLSVARKVRAVQRFKDFPKRAAAQSAHELIILCHDQFLPGIGLLRLARPAWLPWCSARWAWGLGGADECVDFLAPLTECGEINQSNQPIVIGGRIRGTKCREVGACRSGAEGQPTNQLYLNRP
jgi:hypothetical protein